VQAYQPFSVPCGDVTVGARWTAEGAIAGYGSATCAFEESGAAKRRLSFGNPAIVANIQGVDLWLCVPRLPMVCPYRDFRAAVTCRVNSNCNFRTAWCSAVQPALFY